MTGRPKRHHYLPKNYLEGFCRDGKLWVRDRQLGHTLEQTPVNTAVKNHYYSHVSNDGSKNPVVEEKLLSEIDGWFPPLRKVLLDGGQLDWEQRQKMALFVSLLMLRTPGFQSKVEAFQKQIIRHVTNLAFTDVSTTAQHLKQFERDTGKASKATPEKLYEFHKSGNYTIEISRNQSIRQMLEMFQEMAERLIEMRWFAIRITNTRTSAATSDNPFVVYAPQGRRAAGIETKGAFKIVPLHQNLFLGVGDRCDMPDEIIHIEEKVASRIRMANEATTANSDRFIIARDQILVDRLATSRT